LLPDDPPFPALCFVGFDLSGAGRLLRLPPEFTSPLPGSQFSLQATKPADLGSSLDNVQVCRGCGAIQAAHLLRASRRFTGSFAHRQMTAAASCRSSRPAVSCPCRSSHPHPAARPGHLFPSWRPLHSRRSLTTARQSSQVGLSVTNLLFLSFRASLLWLGELKS